MLLILLTLLLQLAGQPTVATDSIDTTGCYEDAHIVIVHGERLCQQWDASKYCYSLDELRNDNEQDTECWYELDTYKPMEVK
jgi:hypothetical protein